MFPTSRPAVVVGLLIGISFAPFPSAAQQTERRVYVDNAAGSDASYSTIDEALKAAGTNATIIVRGGGKPYAGGFRLMSGQSLIGQGTAPVIEATSGDVIAVHGISDVTLENIAIRGSGTARGLAVSEGRGSVTLRDVQVTTAGGVGIAVNGAEKLVVTGVSSVDAVDGAALVIEKANLDVVFRSVSARGEHLENGLSLTRTEGRFLIEGIEGKPGSGGTIEGASRTAIGATNASNLTFRRMNILGSAKENGATPLHCGGDLSTSSTERCHSAVHLRSVENAVLDGLVIDGSGQAGILARAVTGLSVLHSEVRNAGNEVFEHGIVLHELRGQARIAGTKFVRSASRHIMLHNEGGEASLLVDGCSFIDNREPHGQQAILISAAKDAAISFRVLKSTFERSFSHAIDVTANDQTRVTVNISGSTFHGNAGAVNIAATDAAVVDYAIVDNPDISGTNGNAINVYLGVPSLGRMSGTIARNVIGRDGVSRSGAQCDSCNGIALTSSGDGSFTADVGGNVIQQVGNSAIVATAGQGGSQMNVTVRANLIRQPINSTPAIRVLAGTGPDDLTSVCADLGGAGANANKIEGTWDSNGAIHLMHRFGGARFQLAGLSGGHTDTMAAASVAARNGGVRVRAVVRDASREKGFEPVERCTMPALTP